MENNNTQQSVRRLDWVDGLKGICAMIVVVWHTNVATSFYLPQIPVIQCFWNGGFAVSIFIMLSAMLACHSINCHRDNLIQQYRRIVLKRYFRLMVPVGAILLFMYLLDLIGLFYVRCTDSVDTLIHLPGIILGAPLGGTNIMNVTWMLPYVFLGTMWVIILDLLLYGRKWQSQLFLLAICLYIAVKTNANYANVVIGYAVYSLILRPFAAATGGGQYPPTPDGVRCRHGAVYGVLHK